jgi:hypothetical protein
MGGWKLQLTLIISNFWRWPPLSPGVLLTILAVMAPFTGLLSGVEFTNFLVEGFTFVPVWVGGLFSE